MVKAPGHSTLGPCGPRFPQALIRRPPRQSPPVHPPLTSLPGCFRGPASRLVLTSGHQPTLRDVANHRSASAGGRKDKGAAWGTGRTALSCGGTCPPGGLCSLSLLGRVVPVQVRWSSELIWQEGPSAEETPRPPAPSAARCGPHGSLPDT